MQKEAWRQFQPELVECFIKCKKEIDSQDVEVIRKALEDLSQSSSGVISKLYAQAQAETNNGNNNNGDDEIIVDDKKD